MLAGCSPAYRDGKRTRREAIQTLETRLRLGRHEAEQLSAEAQVGAYTVVVVATVQYLEALTVQ
jgi:hypothetical protein